MKRRIAGGLRRWGAAAPKESKFPGARSRLVSVRVENSEIKDVTDGRMARKFNLPHFLSTGIRNVKTCGRRRISVEAQTIPHITQLETSGAPFTPGISSVGRRNGIRTVAQYQRSAMKRTSGRLPRQKRGCDIRNARNGIRGVQNPPYSRISGKI